MKKRNFNFTKTHVIFTSLVFILLFSLVYSPHINYRFPLHVDEWHHIHETLEIKDGQYSLSTASFRIGFQIFLLALSFPLNLVESFHLFPAIWAVLSGIVLYLFTYKKTENLWISILSVLFFASIKSNVNLMGLWFFTPLTFSIPFIFAFMYFYSEGLEKKSKKNILLSLVFMAFLIPIHIISFSFAIPILLIYSTLHYKYILKEWKFFSSFLIIPLFAFLFYYFVTGISITNLFSRVISDLSFKYGWGVYERQNSFLEMYSLMGYLFALIGIVTLFLNKHKKNFLYIIWPLVLLISIFFFRFFGVSFFSPYQRNMYYLVISLPFLSAIGAFKSFSVIKRFLIKGRFLKIKKLIFLLLILIIFRVTFMDYYDIPAGINVYYSVDEDQYLALKFMQTQEGGVILTRAMQGAAVYPISRHEPFSSLFFYGKNRGDWVKMFYDSDCKEKESYLSSKRIDYVLEDYDINCGWEVIYNKTAWIYDVKEFKKS